MKPIPPIELVDPKKIQRAPFNNPTRHEKIHKALLESIRTFGVKDPIDCYREGRKLISVDGNRRTTHAIEANLKQVPIRVWPKEDAIQIFHMNRTKQSFTGNDWLFTYFVAGAQFVASPDREQIESHIETFGEHVVEQAFKQGKTHHVFRDIKQVCGILEQAHNSKFIADFGAWVVNRQQYKIVGSIKRNQLREVTEALLPVLEKCVSSNQPWPSNKGK